MSSGEEDRGCVPQQPQTAPCLHARVSLAFHPRQAFTSKHGTKAPGGSKQGSDNNEHPTFADYEDGEWEGGEFFARGQAKAGRSQSKEEAVYGVFGAGGTKPVARRKGGKPLAFVSGGAKSGGDSRRGGDSDSPPASSDDEDLEAPLRPMGRTRAPPLQPRAPAPAPAPRRGLGSGGPPSFGGADLGSWTKSSSGAGFAAKYLSKFGFKGRLGKHEQGMSQPVAVKVRPAKLGLGAGGFKEATHLPANKAVVAELLESDPLGGVKRARAAEEAGVQEDADVLLAEEEEALTGVPAAKRQRRPRTVYRTAAEVLGEGGGPTGGGTLIVDMTGGTATVVGSVSDLVGGLDLGGAVGSRAAAPTPRLGDELLHNVDTVVEGAQGRLRAAGAAAAAHAARQEALAGDVAACEKQLGAATASLAAARAAAAAWAAVMEGVEGAKSGLPAVGKLAAAIKGFAVAHSDIFGEMSLSSGVWEVLGQVLKPALAAEDWAPTQQDAGDALAGGVGPWVALVDTLVALDASSLPPSSVGLAAPPAVLHKQRLQRGLMGRLDAALAPLLRRGWDDWDARTDTGALMGVLVALQGGGLTPPQPLVSPDVLTGWLTGNVAPAVVRAVSGWDPAVDTVTLASWLGPWAHVPSVAAALPPVMPRLLATLEGALQGWAPADPSAAAMFTELLPLLPVRPAQATLARLVTPRLAAALTVAAAAPGTLAGQGLQWWSAWAGLLPDGEMVALAAGALLPGWLAQLSAAAASKAQPLSTLLQGVQAFLAALPLCVAQAAPVQGMIETGYRVLAHAAGAQQGVPAPRLPAARPLPLLRQALQASGGDKLELVVEAEGAAADPTPVRATTPVAGEPQWTEEQVTLMDAVGHLAGKAGVPFLPSGKRVQGQALYKLGDRTVLLRSGVVWAEAGEGVPFQPLPLSDLIPVPR